MKLFTAVVIIMSTVIGTAYFSGVFDAEVSITVNQKVKDDVAELTLHTVEKAQESTDKAFEALKEKIKESNKHGK